jgi:CRP/FNR family transcriptional regulator, cyclic AMP receptor protein
MSDDTHLLELLNGRNLPTVHVPAGDKLFLQGESAGSMYVVVSGALEVLIFGRILERVGRGGIVGEMALIDAGTRSAAALTETDCELICVGREALLKIIRDKPSVALAVLAVLARRLRAVTQAKLGAAGGRAPA